MTTIEDSVILTPTESVIPEIKKKRGRGRPRKYKKVEPKVLKKRGRKKKTEKIVCNLNDIAKIHLNSEKIVNKSIIVHLPIDIKMFEQENNKIFEQDYLNYNTHINLEEPLGFELNGNTLMNIEQEQVENLIEQTNEQKEYTIKDNNRMVVKKINNVMIEFTNFKDQKFFRTDICCWHCCHKFNSMPCGIPHSYEDGIFNILGVFCSFNCALTYNYDSKINENDIQERESLLYMMYKKINNVKEIDLPYAPEKQTLKMFGGLLTIEEFRKNQNVYSMVYPPMLSIIPQLEEIKILENVTDKKNLILNMGEKNKKKNKNTLDSLFKMKN